MVHEDNLNVFIPLEEPETEYKQFYDLGQPAISDSKHTIILKSYMAPGENLVIKRHPRFAFTGEHTHDCIELMYVLSGSVTHHIGGDDITVREGDILIMRQFTSHSIDVAHEKDIAVNFLMNPAFFDRTLEMLGEEPSPLHNFFTLCMKADTGTNEYLHISLGRYPHIQSLMDVMVWNMINGVSNKNSINENLMGLIMLLLQDTADSNFGQPGDKTIWQVLHYIERHYKDCSLRDCADNLHFDYYALANKVKKETGKTFVKLVQEKRLSQATYLLRSTPLTVHEIANAVGYENEGFFYRLFTAQYGLSPREYRKKYN